MKSTDIINKLDKAIAANLPAFIWGAPGIGKSSVVEQVAAARKTDLIDLRVVLLDPVDLRGLPHIDVKTKTTEWMTPSFLPTKGKGILFLDELNAAPAMVQNACLQLVLNRKLGEYTLPTGWYICAAGNRDTDGALVQRMSSALKSRFIHLQFDADVNAWCAWGALNGIAPEIIAFLRFRPELLHKYTKDQNAFPCPRTWEYASRLLRVDPQGDYQLLQGTIGEAAAVEFSGFLRMYRDMVSPDAIVANPDGVPVPTSPGTLYAVATALSHFATAANLKSVTRFLARVPKEYSVLCINDATTRDPKLKSTAAYTQWGVLNAESLY